MDYSDKISDYLQTLAPKVRDNLEIATHETVGRPYFFHISANAKIKSFVPRIGDRQAITEDRTVPRVCVCDTLYGCMLGYASILNLGLSGAPKKGDEKKKSIYKEGWYIYKIPFIEALKPNKKLVYDAEKSNEFWLPAYSAETAEYTGEVIGKFFLKEVTFTNRTNTYPTATQTFHLEVSDDITLPINAGYSVGKGYWEIIITELGTRDMHYEKNTRVVVNARTKEEYEKSKQYSAALLSDQPAILKW